jgi:hypothetical protein
VWYLRQEREPQKARRRVRTLLKTSDTLKHRQTTRFADLRQTAGSAIANGSAIDLAERHRRCVKRRTQS